jgi:hypothetical protein
MRPEERYPFLVDFDGSPCPARVNNPGELPGLYIDLGHVEHLVAGDHPLLEVVRNLNEYNRFIWGLFTRCCMARFAGTRSTATLSGDLEDTETSSGCRGTVPPAPSTERDGGGNADGTAPHRDPSSTYLGSLSTAPGPSLAPGFSTGRRGGPPIHEGPQKERPTE